MADFFKFPSTPHLAILAEVSVRGDKVMMKKERIAFLAQELLVEEKIDGANLGISFDADGELSLQNRGSFISLPGTGQWRKLQQWIDLRLEQLFDHLADRYILFGEWCYACHSVQYKRLPDYFIGFDVYDKQAEAFFSVRRRNDLLQQIGIPAVPLLGEGRFTLEELLKMIGRSAFADTSAEGLYLRQDSDEWLIQRAKLVRSGFIQNIGQHWLRGTMRVNDLQDGWKP